MYPSQQDVGFLANGVRTKEREVRGQEVCSDCASSDHLLFVLDFNACAALTMDVSRRFATFRAGLRTRENATGRNGTHQDRDLAGSSHGGLVSMYAKLIAAQRGIDAKNAASAAWG